MGGCPGMRDLVDGDIPRSPFRCEEASNFACEAGECPIAGIDDVARPEAVRPALRGGDDCAPDPLDGDAMEQLLPASRERQIPDTPATRSTKYHSRVSANGL